MVRGSQEAAEPASLQHGNVNGSGVRCRRHAREPGQCKERGSQEAAEPASLRHGNVSECGVRCRRHARVHPAEAQAGRSCDAPHRVARLTSICHSTERGQHIAPPGRVCCVHTGASARLRAARACPTGCPCVRACARVRAPRSPTLSAHSHAEAPSGITHTARPRAARAVDARHAPSTVLPLGSGARAVDASSRGLRSARPTRRARRRRRQNKCLKFTPTFLTY